MCEDLNKQEAESELEFLSAMRAYRAARDSGDAQAMAAAEDAWRELVRAELVGESRGEAGE